MIQSICEWLLKVAGGLLDLVVTGFINAIDPSLSFFLEVFPSFAIAYSAFKIIAYGFTLLIAARALYGFFFVSGASPRSQPEAPWRVLLRVMLSAALISAGGYVLEELVDISKLAYEFFAGMDYTETTFEAGTQIVSWDTLGLAAALGLGGFAVTAAVLLVFNLFVVCIIAIELLRLMLEIVQRYALIGVMVFTSPLIFSTCASESTSQIFKRWVQMFVSSLILLSLNIFFLKASLGAMMTLDTSNSSLIVRLLMIVALIRVGQQIDNFLNSLGLAAPRQGLGLFNSLLAEGIGIARMAGHFATPGSFKSTVLGRAAQHTNVAKIANAVKAGKSAKNEAIANGLSKEQANDAAKDARKQSFKKQMLGDSSKFSDRVKFVAKNSADTILDTTLGRKPFADHEQAVAAEEEAAAAQADAARIAAEVKANKAAAEETRKFDAAEKTSERIVKNQSVPAGNRPLEPDVAEKYEKKKPTSREATQNLKDYGVEKNVVGLNSEGDFAVAPRARAAGIELSRDSSGKEVLTGSDAALQASLGNAMLHTTKQSRTKEYAAKLNENDPEIRRGNPEDTNSSYYKSAYNSTLKEMSAWKQTEKGGSFYEQAAKWYNDQGESEIPEEKIHDKACEIQTDYLAAVKKAEGAPFVEFNSRVVDRARDALNHDKESQAEELASLSSQATNIYADSIRATKGTQQEHVLRNIVATADVPVGGRVELEQSLGEALVDTAYNPKHEYSNISNVHIERSAYHSTVPGVDDVYANTLVFTAEKDGIPCEVRYMNQVVKDVGALPSGYVAEKYVVPENNGSKNTVERLYRYEKPQSAPNTDSRKPPTRTPSGPPVSEGKKRNKL